MRVLIFDGGVFYDPYPQKRFDALIYVKVLRIRMLIFVNSPSHDLFKPIRGGQ